MVARVSTGGTSIWRTEPIKASLTGHQGSGNLFSLVQANALLIVPAGVKVIPAGEEISAWALEAGLE